MPMALSAVNRWLIIALFAITVGSAAARDLPGISPAKAGFSSERLTRLTTFMHAQVEAGVMVGGQALIARGGRVVYDESYGHLDRERGIPMPADAIYRIYSMTKPITAVALMMLYEEGKFSLNEPLARYLPQLADLQVLEANHGATQLAEADDAASSKVAGAAGDTSDSQTREPVRQPTIRDLLRHTAGMTYGVFGDSAVDRAYREAQLLRATDLEDFVSRLGTLPLMHEPGSRWHYSVAVDVQGRLVEVLSGMRFSAFLQQRIFSPLGMVDTSFVLPPDKRSRLAQLYSPEGTYAGPDRRWRRNDSQTLVVADEELSRPFLEGNVFESGGGGLLSTASDYLRFCQMLLNGGELDGVRLLSPHTVDLMTRSHTGNMAVAWGSPGLGFGLGFAVVTDTGLAGETGSDGEYRWGGAAGTEFWVDPKQQLIGILMVQSIPHQTRLRQAFHQLTYQAVVE